MPVAIFTTRLMGGRNVGIKFDSTAGSISIAGQSLTLSTVSPTLQAQWANAVANAPPGGSVGAFGGDLVGQAAAAIADATPAWRTSVQTAVSNYAASVAPYGDPETWNRC